MEGRLGRILAERRARNEKLVFDALAYLAEQKQEATLSALVVASEVIDPPKNKLSGAWRSQTFVSTLYNLEEAGEIQFRFRKGRPVYTRTG